MASIPLAACCLAGAALMQPPRPMIRIRAAALGNRNPAWIPATVAVVAIAAFALLALERRSLMRRDAPRTASAMTPPPSAVMP